MVIRFEKVGITMNRIIISAEENNIFRMKIIYFALDGL